MKQLIVFDLDGTLVDSRLDLAQSANEVLASYGATPLRVEQVVRMVGEGARVLVERVVAARQLKPSIDEALERFLVIYERRIVEHTRPYPGAIEALEALAPLATLAVLTNKPARHTALLLDALGLKRYFVAALGFDGTFPRKPDPAGLLHLVSVSGATRPTTIMVGDSPVDAETARRAGTQACVLHYGFGQFDGVELPEGTVEVADPLGLKDALIRAIS